MVSAAVGPMSYRSMDRKESLRVGVKSRGEEGERKGERGGRGESQSERESEGERERRGIVREREREPE